MDNQKLLENHLDAGETLIEFTRGHIGGAGMEWIVVLGLLGRWLFNKFFANWHAIGLTDQRLLLVQKKDGALVHAFALAEVNSVTYARDAGWVSSTMPGMLKIDAGGEKIEVEIQGKRWWEQAELIPLRFKDAKKKASA
jgi:hypothetical protein